MITYRDSSKRFSTSIENILTHWSVAQAGSNDGKKTGGRWKVPLSITNDQVLVSTVSN